MKISRKVWLILGAVILVAALVSVYMVYFQQTRERKQLNDRKEAAETLWRGLTASKNVTEEQLKQATDLLDDSRTQFPRLESIEYGEDLFEIAVDCNVGITKITASPPTGKKVGTVTYSVSSFVVGVSGSIDDILKFINTIRTDERFASADVKSVNIDVAGSATINLDIYGYKG